MKRTSLRWTPALAWEALIFWQSSLSRVPGTKTGEALFGSYLPLLAHVAEYFVLAVLLGMALRVAPDKGGRWLLALGLSILLAATDELHQAFVPGRSSTLSDMGWDALGACLALGLWRLGWELRLSRSANT